MRLFEILIPVPLTIHLIWPFVSGKANPRWINLLPLLAAVLVVAHLIFEGYRWQMVLLYLLAGILTLVALPALFYFRADDFHRLSWLAAGRTGTLILLTASTVLPALLPVPSIPMPSGPYQVGTQSLILVDPSRRELYSGKDEPRKFMVQIWYPADPAPGDQHAPWMDHATVYGRTISKYLGLPEFFLDHLALAKTPAWRDAPLKPSDGGYPMILFSHGWNGFAAQNTGQALELASRGFVVVALQHTYGAVVTVFPDGEIAYNNPSALPGSAPEQEYDIAAHLLADQWAGDMSYTLDVLGNMVMDVRGHFWGAFDFNRIGVYGHSTGGGAAIQFCGKDSRCKALLGMDPFMTSVPEEVLNSGVSQPALFMFSQRWADDMESKNARLFDEFYSRLDPATRVFAIRGTAHYDFTDLPMLSPIAPQLGLKGPLNGKRVTEIMDSTLISFFEASLNDQPSGLLDGLPIKYPEVIPLH
jgi:predicted dienelactone hydrolase